MIHGGMVGTSDPYWGLPPQVLNAPAQWIAYPKVSVSGAVVTKTQQTAGSSVAAGTQPDYARNLNVVITPTVSSGGVTAGGVTVWGRDVLGVTRSESYPATGCRSASAGVNGTVNFASVATVSMKLSFHSDTSSAANAYAVVVGVANKLGLPVSIANSNAVFAVHWGTAVKLTSSGASSTNNEYTVCTGDYWKNGIMLSAFSSATLLQVDYAMNGQRGAYYFPQR